MKQTHLLCALLVSVAFGCSDDEKNNGGGGTALPPFAAVTAPDGTGNSTATIDNAQKTIHFNFSERTSLTEVPVTFDLNEGYALEQPETETATLDLSAEQTVIVSREGTPVSYTLTAESAAIVPPPTPFQSIRLEYCAVPVEGSVTGAAVKFPLTVYTSDNPDLKSVPVIVELHEGYTLENGNATDTLSLDLSDKARILVTGPKTTRYTLSVETSHELPAYTDFPIGSGYNLAYWFGQGQGWISGSGWADDGVPYFGSAQQEEIERLAGYGFDHFRIPLDEEVVWNKDGSFREEGIQTLHNVIGWIRDAGCRAIVDLHWLYITNNMPNEEAEKHFRRCWKMLHEELKDYPNDLLAYELLNEPNGRDGYWNTFLANSIAMLRGWGEKERVIFCATNNYQEINGAPEMILPKNDPNLVMSFHDYHPMLLTHYAIKWSASGGYNGPIHYPGQLITDNEWDNVLTDEQREQAKYYKRAKFSASIMKGEMQVAYFAAQNLGVRLHCGEFACASEVPLADRLRWYQDMTATFRELNIAFSFWPFGLGENDNNGQPHPEIIKALTGKDI